MWLMDSPGILKDIALTMAPVDMAVFLQSLDRNSENLI